MIDFLLVDYQIPYKALMGRPFLKSAQKIKLRTDNGIGIVRSNQKKARNCYAMMSRRTFSISVKEKNTSGIENLPNREDFEKIEKSSEATLSTPDHPLILGDVAKVEEVYEVVPISLRDLEKVIKVGSQLSPNEKKRLVTFLRDNADVFTWSHEEMSGIDPKFICHCLFVDPKARPIK